MGDIQFSRGYVNQQAADAGRFGQRATAPGTQGPEAKTPGEAAAAQSTADDEFGFDDFLDIINPLQHIPIVSTLYRELTGDEISAPARIFGGTLFGGPTGFVSAVANTFFDEIAGEDVGASVLAFFGGEGTDDGPQLATPNTDPPISGPPGTGQAGNAFSAAPLVTAASRTATDPTGPASTGTATDIVIPAGLLPITTPPRAQSPGSPPPPDRTPNPGPAAPAGSLQESDRKQGGGNDGVLTGQDALSALFNDLRGGAAAAPLPSPLASPLASTAAPVPTGPSRETKPLRQISDNDKATERVVNTPMGSGTDTTTAPDPVVPDAALANQMLTALDKYQAMTRQRGLANPPQPKPDRPEHP